MLTKTNSPFLIATEEEKMEILTALVTEEIQGTKEAIDVFLKKSTERY